MKYIKILAVIFLSLTYGLKGTCQNTNPELGQVVNMVKGMGHVIRIGSHAATMLGLGDSALSAKEFSREEDSVKRSINTIFYMEQTWILLSKNDKNKNGNLYLTQPDGVLKKAFHKADGKIIQIPLEDATTDFNTEKSYWKNYTANGK